MAKTLEQKKAIVEDLKRELSESQVVVAIGYQGLTVAEITDLRKRLYETGSVCKVTKNTLMGIAVDGDENWQPVQEFLRNDSAFLFLKDDLSAAIKAYQDFQKDTKKTELRGGVMEGRALKQEEVQAIADLPSREELMARIAGAIQAVPTRVAAGTQAVPTKVAVGINEVPSKLARALKAVSEKDESQDAA